MNRVAHLTSAHLCGARDLRIVGYGDDHRWEVRCNGCGHVEHWTQSQWRTATREPVQSSLVTVAVDDS